MNAAEYLIGFFDKIPVYISYSEFLQGRFLIAAMGDAFQMQVNPVEHGYDSELTARVSAVTDEQAKALYDRHTDHFRRRSGHGVDLSEAEALMYIKNGVYLEISTTDSFNIIDADGYLVGIITEPN